TLVPITSGGIAYDPTRDRIYASVPSSGGYLHDRIVVIDPYRAFVESTIPFPTDPQNASLSDDNQFLYLSISNNTAVRRLNLASGLTELNIQAEPGFNVTDLAVPPGQCHSVAIARGNTFVSVFDEGVQRTNNVLAFGAEVLRFGSNAGE